jgi:hypothetical protein
MRLVYFLPLGIIFLIVVSWWPHFGNNFRSVHKPDFASGDPSFSAGVDNPPRVVVAPVIPRRSYDARDDNPPREGVPLRGTPRVTVVPDWGPTPDDNQRGYRYRPPAPNPRNDEYRYPGDPPYIVTPNDDSRNSQKILLPNDIQVRMAILISLAMLIVSLKFLLSPSDPLERHWGFGALGTLVGFWLRGLS